MSSDVQIIVDPCRITYVSRIMEGYEYLGVVTTLDRARGLLVIRTTADSRHDAIAILKSLPVRVEFVS